MPTATMRTVKPIDAASDGGVSLAFRNHWPEYLMEAAALGIFMISACIFTVLLEHPACPVHQAIENGDLRRVIAGVAMGLTAIGIFFSPWGKRSGAHMNPCVTISFLLLGKIQPWDACFYVAAQFAGGILGVGVSELIVGLPLRHTAVNYAVTTPGYAGVAVALIAEALISAGMMAAVLWTSNSRRWSRYTPILAGVLVAAYISIEAPLSGMSMNPARTVGSGLFARDWTALWIYFAGPALGMLGAAQLYRARRGIHRVYCAKLHHHNAQRCIFNCNYPQLNAGRD
ncbi:MAG: aquaporin [Bryobacteraceae bacterium]